MSDGPVILTREQWSAIWDEADALRERTEELVVLRDALEEIGVIRAVDKIDQACEAISETSQKITSILIAAEEAPQSNPETEKAA